MTAAAFDTLKFARTLKERGKLSSEQAEGLTDALAEAFQNDLATKHDMTILRSDLGSLRAEVGAELRELELRVNAQIEASKAETIRWMFGTIGFQTLIILGAVIALTRIVQP